MRYADVVNIFAESKRAGERIRESVGRYVEGKLKLIVKREKSAVRRPLLLDCIEMGCPITVGKKHGVRVVRHLEICRSMFSTRWIDK